jgi:hypothetical protein
MDDKTLAEAIKDSGYYELRDVNLDDLPSEKRTVVILVTALLALRPDLEEENPDVVFLIQRTFENGSVGCSFPKKNLSELLKTSPYDDSAIYSYSLKEGRPLKCLYKGTGTKWELVK